MYVAVDKFTKWPEVEAVRKVTAQSAVKFFKELVCRFGVPNRVITDNGTQFSSPSNHSSLLALLGLGARHTWPFPPRCQEL